MPKPLPSYATLADAAYVSLRTFRKNGTTVDTPVWIAGLDGSLVAFTDGTSYKVKRIRADSRAAVAVCNVSGQVSSAWVEASVAIVTDRERERRAYEVLRAKYGWQMRGLDFVSWLGGRIGRRVVLEIRLVDSPLP
jgi:PPOX class probable F420-dependent enzyme